MLLLALILPIIIIGVRQIQDIRNRAAGTNEVVMDLSPSSGTLTPGQQVKVKVNLTGVGRNINISGAQATLSIDAKFTINSVVCLAPFNGLPYTRIQGTTITLMCAIGTG